MSLVNKQKLAKVIDNSQSETIKRILEKNNKIPEPVESQINRYDGLKSNRPENSLKSRFLVNDLNENHIDQQTNKIDLEKYQNIKESFGPKKFREFKPAPDTDVQAFGEKEIREPYITTDNYNTKRRTKRQMNQPALNNTAFQK